MSGLVVLSTVALLIMAVIFFSVGSGKKAYLLKRHLPTNLALLVKNEMAETDEKINNLWEKLRSVHFSREVIDKEAVYQRVILTWQKELANFFETASAKLEEKDKERLSKNVYDYWLEVVDILRHLRIKVDFPFIGEKNHPLHCLIL